MFGLNTKCVLSDPKEYLELDDYAGRVSRWCPGCGDNGILAAVQRLCRDEQFPLEKTVFISGIGCAARFPHYVSTYGFHGLHGRALPTAQGVRIRRPDLNIFVNMGDGDCCSIGTAHWIHAVRMNFKMVAMLHDNNIYGLTKKQASPTTPMGWKTNTTPAGAFLDPLNPISATLGITNVSFVAQVVEWIPELLFDVIRRAHHHNGFAFIRILQRCPHFMPTGFQSLLADPNNLMLLRHENGMKVSDELARVYKTQEEHDPSDLNNARRLSDIEGKVPIGIFYQNQDIPRYDEIRRPRKTPTWQQREQLLSTAFDRFGIDQGANA